MPHHFAAPYFRWLALVFTSFVMGLLGVSVSGGAKQVVGSERGRDSQLQSQQPGSQQPGSQQPGSQQPGSQQPVSQQPGSQQPGSQQPVSEVVLTGPMPETLPQTFYSNEEMLRWVRQLGDPAYQQREKATQQLTEAGLQARSVLLAHTSDPDPERRRRCRRILHDVLEQDFQGRLQKFAQASDPNAGTRLRLPGWERFRRVVGQGPEDCKLFVAMQRTEGGLLASAEASSKQAAAAVQLRFQQILQMMQGQSRYGQSRKQPPEESIAALLLVMTDPKLDPAESVANNTRWGSLIQQLTTTISKDAKRKEQFRPLLDAWVRQESSPNLFNYKLRIALQFKLPSGLWLAIRTAENKKVSGPIRLQAIQGIAQLGGKAHRRRLLPFLADQTEVTRVRRGRSDQYTVQVRDAALGWLVHLCDQDIKAYGQERAASWLKTIKRNSSRLYFNYTIFGFTKDQQRQEALQRWKKWAEGHPLPEPPALPSPLIGPHALQETPDQSLSQANSSDPAPAQNQKTQNQKTQNQKTANQPVANRPVALRGVFPAGGPAPALQLAQAIQLRGVPVQGRAQVLGQVRLQLQAGPGAPAADGQEASQEDELAVDNGLLVVDREWSRLAKKSQQFIEEGEYADAALLLDRILASRVDYSFQDEQGVPLFRRLKLEAERLIGALPPEGREVYQLRFGTTARRLLEGALQEANYAQVAAVSDRYFHTQAGAKATYLLGCRARDLGQPLLAAAYFRRLRERSTEADRYEPYLSMQLAACWLRAGWPKEANGVLAAVQQNPVTRINPATRIKIGGTNRPLLAQGQERLGWLESLIGPQPRPPAAEGWPLLGGTPDRNRLCKPAIPWPARYSVGLTANPLIRQSVQKIQQQYNKERWPNIPSTHPLLVGQTILARSATGLTAYDLNTGQLRWRAEFDDLLGHLIRFGTPDQRKQQAEEILRGLRERLWENESLGILASDGERVFGVEQFAFPLGPGYQRTTITPEGRRRLDVDRLQLSNSLAAYDVTTGKLLWEAGGPDDTTGLPGQLEALLKPILGQQPAAGQQTQRLGVRQVIVNGRAIAINQTISTTGTPLEQQLYFLGPPLPLGRELYAVADFGPATLLLALSGKTGQLLWHLPLDDRGRGARALRQVQLAASIPGLQLGRPAGLTPSYSNGMLVCPTSGNRFVAIDLATRRASWLWDAPNQRLVGTRLTLQVNTLRPFRSPTLVTVAQQKALLTPQGSDQLVCVELNNGQLQWKASLQNALYVGGVDGLDDGQEPRVLIVGRSSINAVRLTTGEEFWENGPAQFPQGATPAGRGYLAPGRYYLPLSSGEVAIFDTANGRLIGSTQAPEANMLGNLICHKGVVISQSFENLVRFDSSDTLRQELLARLDRQPDNPQVLADYGELLLNTGKLELALDLLQRAAEAEGRPEYRRLLARALNSGLQADFARFEPQAEATLELLPEAQFRQSVFEQLLRGYRQNNAINKALAVVLELLDLPQTTNAQDQKLVVASAERMTRPALLWQTELELLRQQATLAQQQELDQRVSELLDSLQEDLDLSAKPNKQLEKHLRHLLTLSGHHPRASDIRLKLADQLKAQKKLLAAELQLRVVLQEGTGQQKQQAALRLASLMVAAGHSNEASAVRRFLVNQLQMPAAAISGQLPNVPTGGPQWPLEPPQIKTAGGSSSIRYNYPIRRRMAAGPIQTPLLVNVDSASQKVTVSWPDGQRRIEVSLPQGGRRYYSSSIIYYSRALQVGHLLVMHLGNQVHAIDTLAAKPVLWTQSLVRERPFDPPGVRRAFFRFPQRVNAATPPGALTMPIAATADCVCFQRDDELVAVEPTSGEVLWTRDGVTKNSDLLADNSDGQSLLFVLPRGQQQATVLSLTDGRVLGERRVPPPGDRLYVMGRQAVVQRSQDDQTIVQCQDLWNGQVRWRLAVPQNTRIAAADTGEAVLLQPDGQLRALDLTTGQTICQTKLPQGQDVTSLFVLPGQDRLVVVANHPEKEVQDQPNQVRLIGSIYPGNRKIDGTVFGIDRASGKLLWQAEIRNQAVRSNFLPDLPLLVFLNRHQEIKQLDNGRRSIRTTGSLLQCLDTRTGQLVYDKKQDRYAMYYTLKVDPKKKTIELLNRSEKVTFDFSQPKK